MKTQEEFERFYEKELAGQTEKIEVFRQASKKKLTIHLLKTILIVLICWVVMRVYSKDVLLTLPFIAYLISGIFLFLIFYGIPFMKEKKKITTQIKESIMPLLLQFIHPNFYYLSTGYVSKDDFIDSNLYLRHEIDRYDGDDYIKGKIDQTTIQFSELRVQKESKDSEGKSTYRTIFQGLFFVVDFNKDFSGSLYAMSKHTKFDFFTKLSKHTRTNENQFLEDVELENGEFNEAFLVRSTDQHTARYILTPSFMEALLSFQRKSGYEALFSFKDGKMYLGLKTNREHFEFEMSRTIDKMVIMEYFYDISLSLLLVEELNLNTRIWNK